MSNAAEEDTERNIKALRQKAVQARTKADALARAYERVTWFRFSLVFIPVPFVIVLLRLDLEAWHYYIAGAAYLGFSALLYTIDGRASAKCDAAEKDAVAAEKAFIEPRASQVE